MRTGSLTPVPHDEPPDGGWVAWSQVVPAHVANAMTWGYGAGFSVFQLYYKQTMDLPASQISWIGSIQLFLYFLVGMASGRLSDAGYTRSLYGIGGFFAVLGMFMTSLATEYWQILLAQGFCSGIGGGLMFMPAIANVATYFKRRRNLAMSLNATGSSTGAIVFPAVVQFLTPVIGFPWAMRVCGFIALFFITLGFILLKPRKLKKTPSPWVDLKLLQNAPNAVYAAGAFFIYFSLFTVLIYINSFARDSIGVSDLESINFVLITNALGIPSRPLFGFLADRYTGPINTFGLNCIGLGVLAFGWTGVHKRADMYAYSVVMGFVNGAAQGVFPGATSSLMRDVTRLGTWVGMVFAICGFATLAGPPVMGAIIDHNGGSYLWAQIWAALVIMLGGIFLLASAWLVGTKGTKKLWGKA
ncbi:major facilitator superfamily domain-containing protein [Camillea tinctor]|nr:major facilitator superfamily domain-containing protein [Camillea tinctor]